MAGLTRNVHPETGRLIALAALAANAREIFEIGSSNGVSAIWLASAAARFGGRVTGTERIPEQAALGNANLAAAGLGGVAEIVPGDARATVAAFDRPIDLLFIDAEKDDYPDHLLSAVGKVRTGGLILADNVVSHDLAAFQQLVREREDRAAVSVPIGQGLEWIVKLG